MKNLNGKTGAGNNIVAKHAHKFNKSLVHRDKTKYTRKEKHKGKVRQVRHYCVDNFENCATLVKAWGNVALQTDKHEDLRDV